MTAAPGAYADIDGLRLYYEVHGPPGGAPLVLVHGGFMTIDTLGPILPALAATRRVVAIELEGHGRSVDRDRPLSVRGMARDVGALMDRLGGGPMDLMGFSLGGMVVLGTAALRPERVRRLVAVSAADRRDAFYPQILAQWPGMSPETLAGSPLEMAYKAVAPRPERWPGFVHKMREAMTSCPGWEAQEIAAITAPVLLALGDADMIRPEAAFDLLRRLGGAPEDGGMGAMPASQMAMLPGTNHFGILYRTDVLVPLINGFLDRD